MKHSVLKLEDNDVLPAFAIYSFLEGYRLAYILNKQWGSFFQKITCPKQLGSYKFSKAKEPFEVFKWFDTQSDIKYVLVKNKLICKQPKKPSKLELFENEFVEHSFYWRADVKKADFILEIENECLQYDVNQAIKTLRLIPEINLLTQI